MKEIQTGAFCILIHVIRTFPKGTVLFGFFFFALGCGWRDEVSQPPNVIVVLVDTLRSDHLSAWDYPEQTSPELERLVSQGTKFTSFFSHSAVTRPSVATLFSSRYVSGHGVADQLGGALPKNIPLLSELFDPAVYSRIAFVTNPQIHPDLGFGRGFDSYVTLFPEEIDPKALTPHDLVKVPARAVLTAAGASIDRIGERPFFCYIHLLDPHGPYAPSSEDAMRFVDPGYTGRITGSVADFADLQQHGLDSGPDLDHFVDLYDAEVFSVDRAIGAFVQRLRHRGLLENTHLFVLSDHGEEFMEHGGTGHGIKLYRETVSVPMLWIGPGVPEGRVVDQFVGLIDIAPTVAEALGPENRPDSFQGRSLYTLLSEEEAGAWTNEVVLEGPGVGSATIEGRTVPLLRRGVLTPRLAVLATGCPLGATGWEQLEVFDLASDPEQQQPITVQRSDLDDLGDPDLRAAVTVFENAVAAATSGTVPPSVSSAGLPEEILEKLKKLGYTD